MYRYKIKLTLGSEVFESIWIEAEKEEYETDKVQAMNIGDIKSFTFPTETGFMTFPEGLLQKSHIEFIND